MNSKVTKYHIPINAKNIVLFVHGFGVRFDSRGMFIEIVESLPKDWGYVLFDFYDVKGSDIYITEIKDQVSRLSAILDELHDNYPRIKLHIIAHSKGCIITSILSKPVSGKVIFLAPPEIFGTRIEQYFKKYPGAKEVKQTLIIPRKDGTFTHIPVKYFDNTAAIDAEKVMNDYVNIQEIHLLKTTHDEVIGNTKYKALSINNKVSIEEIDSDHNFTGKKRRKLINYLHKVLGI